MLSTVSGIEFGCWWWRVLTSSPNTMLGKTAHTMENSIILFESSLRVGTETGKRIIPDHLLQCIWGRLLS